VTTWQAPRAAPRRRRRGPIWLATAGVMALCAWLVWFYLEATAGWSVRAASPLGRWYGGVGAGLMLLLVLYSVRHASYRRRLGSLEVWYRSHIWLGIVALALVSVHCGFRCRGPFLTLLQLSFWGSMASGLIGWFLQTCVKTALLRHEGRPVVMQQIAWEKDAARAALTERVKRAILQRSEREALRVARPAAEAAGGAAVQVAARSVAPKPAGAERATTEAEREVAAALRAVRAVRRRNLWRFPSAGSWKKLVQYHGRPVLARLLDDLAPAESAAVLEELERLNQLEVWASYHCWLRGWTTLHLAFTLALAQLILWHIYITTAY
jgi:hypothetical protein